jgi:hypothetical protein
MISLANYPYAVGDVKRKKLIKNKKKIHTIHANKIDGMERKIVKSKLASITKSFFQRALATFRRLRRGFTPGVNLRPPLFKITKPVVDFHCG